MTDAQEDRRPSAFVADDGLLHMDVRADIAWRWAPIQPPPGAVL